ncbi:hypothetical protein QBC39DRAFT_246064 [Podospora conica]|nr:hypothetical protein QBC39DRAFT_246064 [Schizothecium conicum]
MAQSSSATLGDSLPSVPPNPPTPTPEEVGGREIGPWSLGEVLSEGQTGTVRLGAHRVTGEVVAVKVVAKNRAHISQTASLANLELREAERPSTVPRIPLGIEREVAILKLIRHPNVIHLIDIWENKANLYIVTEFLEKGDMYQFVNWNGPVREHEAISYFRQIMDGMQFVHSLNLCHRDLKLDNILLGPKGQVKIADFGMAAVHQHPRHRLETPCGSIHHAAPEVLNKELYDGCLADIWSMGIILFSMLGSRLPFDEEDLTLMSEKVKKAEYDVPFWFSDEAVDFFSIVLVVDPTQRLSIAEMWGHPLITNYNHVDDLSEPRESTGGRTNNYPPILEANVDPQLLRQLQALWHDYAEEEILWKLRQTSANDFKLFYWLLYRHRERQLEKYGTGASTSEEENHLLKPVNWTQRYAKCDFRRRAHANRFIVFGNDDGETPSDPFFPTGNPQLSPRKPFRVNPANAEFAIHRYKPVRQNRAASTKADNSSTLSSRNGSIGSRGRPVPNPRSRRGVQFSHSRNRSSTRSIRSGGSGSDTTSLRGSVAGESDTEEESREGLSYIQQKPIAKDISTIFEEDVIKSGEEVSGFCDEAFFQNNSMLEAEAASAKLEPTPFKLSLNPEPDMNKLMDQSWYYGPPSDPTPYMNRPLPPTPKTMSAESAEWLRKQKQIPVPPWMPFGGAHLFPTPANLEFTIAGASPGSRHTIHNPAISDPSLPGLSVSGSSGGSSARPASEVPDAIPDAPPAAVKRRKSYMLFPTAHIRNKPAPPGLAPSPRPSNIPAPLNVRKTSRASQISQASQTPQMSQTVEGTEPIPARAPLNIRKISQTSQISQPAQGTAPVAARAPLNIRKISQASQMSQPGEGTAAAARVPINIHRKVTLPNPLPVRERAPLAPRRQVSLVETEVRLKDEARAKELEAARLKRASAVPGVPAWMKRTTRGEALAGDLAEIARPWLARLFGVGGKPTVKYLCFGISRGRTLRKVIGQLEGWKGHGIEELVADPRRGMVWVTVAEKNALKLKPVAFAIEVFRIVEEVDNVMKEIAIARVTLEKGSSRSLKEAVKTMKKAFADRGILVADKSRAKMMTITMEKSGI